MVATVLTACGIETIFHGILNIFIISLQQCLPLAVLKHGVQYSITSTASTVATVLTACGIETSQYLSSRRCASNALQQCLPLAVLKQVGRDDFAFDITVTLQQCLPLAVLKPQCLGRQS